MRKICLVFLTSESFDPVSVFEQAFRELGFETRTVRVPNIWMSSLSRSNLKQLKSQLVKNLDNEFLIFSPQSTELFLNEPDFTLVYSAYRSWFDPGKMRVIPHLWTPVRPPKSFDGVRWTEKPPLRIGFMGRPHTTAKLARLISKLPIGLKEKLLRASYLKYPNVVALTNDVGVSIAAINVFPRTETIEALQRYSGNFGKAKLNVVEKQGFHGSDQELNDYIRHLVSNTYIMCPRGTENYSFRIYEALNYGRLPVIIDTDVVLPKEIDWDRVSVRVPYGSLDKIYEIILEDYESRSGIQFIERQNEAISVMSNLKSMRWVKDVAKEVVEKFANHIE